MRPELTNDSLPTGPQGPLGNLLPGGLVAEVGAVAVPTDKTLRLPDNPGCEYVMLSAWTVTDASAIGNAPVSGGGSSDPADNATLPIYWGFNGLLLAQLFPGSVTQLLPVNNTNQICCKAKTGQSLILRYAFFKKAR